MAESTIPSPDRIAVIAKLMEIFAAAIATQYVFTGIQFYYPIPH
ncbi:MAG: hypothetical protein ABSF63_04630 [Candidatus Bathyarchaeia archaeon]